LKNANEKNTASQGKYCSVDPTQPLSLLSDEESNPLGHAKLVVLSVNSSLTNLVTYSQKHTNRKRKHNFLRQKQCILFTCIFLIEKTSL